MRRILSTIANRGGTLVALRPAALGALAAMCAAALLGAGASSAARTPSGVSWDGLSWRTAASAGGRAAVARSSVIVRARPGAVGQVERAVRRLGGSVGLRLPLVNGFAAVVPSSAVARLERTPGVVSVADDRRLQPLAASYSAYDPTSDLGSMYSVSLMTGAQSYWKAGFTGKGVDVALIDSGVVPVNGLAGRIVNGPDLSFESQASNLAYLDSFGHGTHMAGIIAGMAPDARIVSVKVGDAHGATDVSQVIAAISWVVQHRSDNGLDIRVLNLSYGTNSTQDTSADPLCFAAEQAWKQGVVVVAAAGNAGFSSAGSLTSPARDPFVLAVGATDPNGTLAPSDDRVASFSSSGSSAGAHATGRSVDLVAPGSHIVSLRDPGSLIDQSFGSTGLVTSDLFRGSGTSQAAAVVSGAAALVLQQRPSITPDQLKLLLSGSATKLSKSQNSAQGSGELNLDTALGTSTPSVSKKGVPAPGTGTGSLEAARGSIHLAKDGVQLTGERDIFGAPFDAGAMAQLEAGASSWSGGTWNGNSWSGSSWSTSSWSTSSWSTSSWSGSSWSGSSWSSVLWSASSWSGSSWSGSSWSANNWLGGSWADDTWADASWN